MKNPVLPPLASRRLGADLGSTIRRRVAIIDSPLRRVADVEFRVLGPLEVVDDAGQMLDVGTPKQRAVLCLLLQEPDRVVSLDRIIATLWGDDPPSTATGTLQAYISLLRRVLEPARAARASARVIVTRAPGYLLNVGDGTVDSVEFERLVVDAGSQLAADPAAADGLYGRAIGLWRGSPFVDIDVGDDAMTSVAPERLREILRTARERQAEAKLAIGRHDEAIADLETMVASDPFRERGWELLALARYRAGRQSDAIRALQRARQTLSDEVGLNPGPALISLETRILAQDPDLLLAVLPAAAAIAVPQQRPSVAEVHEPTAPTEGFVGRRRELSVLSSALRSAVDGAGRVTLIRGEAGIGKTRLVEAALGEITLGEIGGRVEVTWGQSHDGAGAPAYWPWTQILGQLLTGRSERPTGSETALLAHVVPDAEGRLGRPPDLPEDPAAAQFLIHRAVSSMLRERAERRPQVVVIEDIHWADTASLRLLQMIAGEIATMRLLIVATYRPEESSSNPDLQQALASIARIRSVDRIDVAGLSAADLTAFVAPLISSVAGSGAERAAGILHSRTGGNPFFVSELVRLLDSEGRLTELANGVSHEPTSVPHAVNDVVRQRVDRLPTATQRLLQLVAVAGRDIDLATLELATGESAQDIMDTLDPALASLLLDEMPGPFGTYRFPHAIVRDAMYQMLSGARRAQLHLRIADALAERHSTNPNIHAGELAHHYSIAAALGTSPQALRWAAAAAEQATGQMADDLAAGFWELAIGAHERCRPDALAERFDLHLALGDARRRAWDPVRARLSIDHAIDIAVILDDPQRMAEAASAFGRITLWNWRDYDEVDQRVIDVLERAIDRLSPDDSELLARTLGALAVELYYDPDRRDESAHHAAMAVAMARRYADPVLLARALNNLYIASWRPQNGELLLGIAAEIINLHGIPDEVRATALLHRTGFLLRHLRLNEFRAEIIVRRGLRATIKSPELIGQLDIQNAALAIFEGRLDDAAALSASMWEAQLRTSSTWGTEWVVLIQQFAIARFRGAAADVTDRLVALAQLPRLGLVRPTAIRALIDGGRTDEARLLFESANIQINDDWTSDFALAEWAEVHIALGVPAPTWLLELAEARADLVVCSGTFNLCLGSMHSIVGRLHGVLGHRDLAVEHLEAALRVAELLASPTIEALALTQLAEQLSERGDQADAPRIAQLVATSGALCDRFGMSVLASRLARYSA